MELSELKLRLNIPLDDTSNDALLELRLEEAVDYVKRRCNQEFEDGLPPSAKIVIEKFVGYMSTSTGNIKSEQIGDSSFEYMDTEDMYKDIDSILVRARLIRMTTL